MLLPVLLASCESRRPAEPPTAARAALSDSATVPLTPAVRPDTTDVSRTSFHFREGHDTTLLIGGQLHRLLLRSETDSTQPLTTVSTGLVGEYFADDTSTFAQTGRVRGYAGSQVITLLDPSGRLVFRRQLRKQDFFAVAEKEIVTVSQPARPYFVGYHAPSQTLVFSIDIGIPASDVGQQCVVVLGLDGRVRHLVSSYDWNWGAADCEPRLLPNGTVLTCQALIRPDGRRISLLKPKSELVAALVLSDSTLLTVYQYGYYRARPDTSSAADAAGVSASFSDPEWVSDPRMRRAPNAFVLDRQGRVRQQFHYQGHYSIIGHVVPRRYVWQTHAYYLLDEARGLHVLDKHYPAGVTAVPFQQMQRFRKPQRPAEVRFVMTTETTSLAFYVDPAQPTRLRYERIERPD
ncbi:hypothetical protein [Hymenobacter sp. B81]|uniref:hypothetical protein n=1 Tax=Hymenobacter sp. B81 TaxID=3344878 RepID=UPI0037DBFD2E